MSPLLFFGNAVDFAVITNLSMAAYNLYKFVLGTRITTSETVVDARVDSGARDPNLFESRSFCMLVHRLSHFKVSKYFYRFYLREMSTRTYKVFVLFYRCRRSLLFPDIGCCRETQLSAVKCGNFGCHTCFRWSSERHGYSRNARILKSHWTHCTLMILHAT